MLSLRCEFKFVLSEGQRQNLNPLSLRRISGTKMIASCCIFTSRTLLPIAIALYLLYALKTRGSICKQNLRHHKKFVLSVHECNKSNSLYKNRYRQGFIFCDWQIRKFLLLTI